MLPFLAYMLKGVFLTGEYFPFLFGFPYSPYNPLSYRSPGEAPHIALGIWEMLLGSPHGLAALMPVIILVPPGFIAMWRGGCSLLAAISGFMIILVIAFAAYSISPISGEGLGARQLIPIMPLLILPLAFLWEEGNGERIWLATLAACTVYMGGLSWAGGPGPLAEKLLDREARSILLSRENIFGTEKYRSTEELVSRFAQALGEHDIAKWLKTLSPVSR